MAWFAVPIQVVGAPPPFLFQCVATAAFAPPGPGSATHAGLAGVGGRGPSVSVGVQTDVTFGLGEGATGCRRRPRRPRRRPPRPPPSAEGGSGEVARDRPALFVKALGGSSSRGEECSSASLAGASTGGQGGGAGSPPRPPLGRPSCDGGSSGSEWVSDASELSSASSAPPLPRLLLLLFRARGARAAYPAGHSRASRQAVPVASSAWRARSVAGREEILRGLRWRKGSGGRGHRRHWRARGQSGANAGVVPYLHTVAAALRQRLEARREPARRAFTRLCGKR